jgi:insertion element IS1 protein InsB
MSEIATNPSKALDKKTLLEEPSNRCFSKIITMHDLVIGLFINRYEFGLLV